MHSGEPAVVTDGQDRPCQHRDHTRARQRPTCVDAVRWVRLHSGFDKLRQLRLECVKEAVHGLPGSRAGHPLPTR